jgi:hypothetical protein
MGVLVKQLGTLGIALPFDRHTGTYRRFLGDTAVVGKGEILVWDAQ